MGSVIPRFVASTVALLALAVAQPALSATQLDPVPLDAGDGSRLGYAHVFVPDTAEDPTGSGVEPIVYLPGFDLNVANLFDSASAVLPGSRESGLKTLRDLVLTDSPHPASQHPQLLERLVDDHGHTVVVLEYADENAGIEQNAKAVESLLTDPELPIMQAYRRTGTRSLLLGWSLGGLIGRYALTTMEYEGVDHHVSLYISYDVPHRGAHIPLSFEAFVALMPRVLVEQSDAPSLPAFEQLLAAAALKYNSTSARQLLLPSLGVAPDASVTASIQARYDQIYAEPDTAAADNAYYAIRDRLWTMGRYPDNLRRIAISNGNLAGNPLAIPMPRDRNLLVRLTASIPVTRRYRLRLMDIRLHDNTLDRARSNCSIEYFFDTTRCPSLRISAELQNLSAGVGSHTNVVARLASAFENQQVLQGEWLGQGYSVEFDSEVPDGEGLTTFIPMSSAFDVDPLEFDAASVDAGQTPFDAVYANSTSNQAHNAVSPDIVDALLGDIETLRQQRRAINALPAIF